MAFEPSTEEDGHERRAIQAAAPKEQGYSEAQSLEFEPNSVNDMHTHDFSAFAFVLSGEFTLVTDDGSVTHHAGEACKLAAGTLHSEQAGASGVTILIGKK